ncbi:nitrilase-related carbon-nitrogen hydrolase [Thermodesulfobacteriota bacterium]
MPTISPISDEALSVVMVQFDPHPAMDRGGIENNIKTICDYVDRAVFSFPGMDLIVFPEYSTMGFSYKYTTHFEFACALPGPEIEIFQAKAREHGVWMCVHIIECHEQQGMFPYNAMILINDQGEIALKYRKVNPWVPKEPWTPGSEVGVCDGPKGSRIAIILCYDGDLPEPAREAAWKGANILLRPSKYMYPWDSIWEVTNRCRALENNIYVVAPNTVGEDRSFSYFGRSMAVDYDGRIIAEMGETAGMTKVDLFPGIVEAVPEKWFSNNNLLNLKHRGYTGVLPNGVKENPYSIYREWDKIPSRWDKIPEAARNVAKKQRELLQELQEKH